MMIANVSDCTLSQHEQTKYEETVTRKTRSTQRSQTSAKAADQAKFLRLPHLAVVKFLNPDQQKSRIV